MTKPRVVHCKKDPYDIYIGRGSKWGNPFVIGEHGDRQMVVEKYEEWLLKQPELLAALPELRGQVLGCYCAPAACHGDVLARLCEVDELRSAYLTLMPGDDFLQRLGKAGMVPGARAILSVTDKRTGARLGAPETRDKGFTVAELCLYPPVAPKAPKEESDKRPSEKRASTRRTSKKAKAPKRRLSV